MKAKKAMRDEHGPRHVTQAGRSVFHELFPKAEADELVMRSTLLRGLEYWLEESGLTQTQAAKALGVMQARVSDIKRTLRKITCHANGIAGGVTGSRLWRDSRGEEAPLYCCRTFRDGSQLRGRRSPGSIARMMLDRVFRAGFRLKFDSSRKSRVRRNRVFQQNRPLAAALRQRGAFREADVGTAVG
jgi:predicted XRE-type DNA-binding protein